MNIRRRQGSWNRSLIRGCWSSADHMSGINVLMSTIRFKEDLCALIGEASSY